MLLDAFEHVARIQDVSDHEIIGHRMPHDKVTALVLAIANNAHLTSLVVNPLLLERAIVT